MVVADKQGDVLQPNHRRVDGPSTVDEAAPDGVPARVAAVLRTRDPALAYQMSRLGVALSLTIAAVSILVVLDWMGAIAVIVASLFVLVDAAHRVWKRRTDGVMVLHLMDAVFIGLGIISAGLPALIAIGPYGYLLTGSVLLLSRRKAFVVGVWTAIWIGVLLIAGDPLGLPDIPMEIIWIATAVVLVVYLGATMYLSSVAALAMGERGELSERLRSSRARLHAIVESSRLIVFALDTRGQVTFTESSGLAAFGAPSGEVVGHSLYELLPDAAELHLVVQELLTSGEPIARDIRIGSAAFHVRLTPEFDAGGHVTGLIGIATDESERVAAADALRHKVEMEQLISRLSTHLIGLEPDEMDDGVALALESMTDFVGADRASILLATGSDGLQLAAHHRAKGVAPLPTELSDLTRSDFPWLISRLASGRLFFSNNIEAIPREGWRLVEICRQLGIESVAIVPIFVFREFAGLAAIDSSRRDAFADDDLVLLRFMAEMLVAVLHRKRVHEQLEELVRSKDEFIASVSHELRTPLTTVVGLAEELRSRPDDFAEEERREFHRLLAEQAAEVSDIVEDLLVIARADIGKVSIDACSLDLLPEIDSVLRGFVDSRAAVADVPDGGVEVWADRTRLRQIVRNLVSNALRYGGDRVEVSVVEEGSVVAVEVADDGGSVTPEQADELFEPYRHTAQVEGRPPSIGLGLTVGRKLAQLMGGDLVFEAREGWSVFRLELPNRSGPTAFGFGSTDESATGSSVPAVTDVAPVEHPADAVAAR